MCACVRACVCVRDSMWEMKHQGERMRAEYTSKQRLAFVLGPAGLFTNARSWAAYFGADSSDGCAPTPLRPYLLRTHCRRR